MMKQLFRNNAQRKAVRVLSFGRKNISFACLSLYLVFLFGCNQAEKPKTNLSGFSAQQKSTPPPFHTRLSVQYAKGFEIKYISEGKLLYLFNGSDTTTLLLLSQEVQVPTQYNHLALIRTPIQKFVALSATHLALVGFLDAYECLSAVSTVSYTYNEQVKQLAATGVIKEVGDEYNLDVEKILALRPDLLMSIGYPNTPSQAFQLIVAAGIPVLANTEWQEKSLLARAEWVKVLAALLAKDSLAQAKFTTVAKRYHKLLKLTDTVIRRPKLISGIPYKGSWGVPAGKSYMALAFSQAGGNYFRKNNKATGGLQLSFETVYYAGLTADIWLNPGAVCSKIDLLEADNRFADLKPFKKGKIYNNNKRTSATGGNDYYESALVNPDVHLADLIKIMHPDLLPKHELVYYQKLH